MTLPSLLSRPLAVSTGETDWASAAGLRAMTRHLRLPSFQPALMVFARSASDRVDWTPSTLRMCQPNWSTSAMMSWSMTALGTVSTSTVMTSTPMLNSRVMTALSWL